MRLATITNWAYGGTVVLTILSGTTMLLASQAQDRERAAVQQRYALDRATTRLDDEIFSLTDHARQYLNTSDASYRLLYDGDVTRLATIEGGLRHVRDAGASDDELRTLRQAIGWADALRDEQRSAMSAHDRGDASGARSILFGAEYERELDRVRVAVERFQYQLDQRTDAQVMAAERTAGLWKRISEGALAFTGLLFLCVLTFVFRQRVLKPVVRLSDVVNRLAAEDYAAEPPNMSQIDEIGDMAVAVRVFRENGLERQRLQSERDSDRAMRELLSRMTQRMQGCDSLSDMEVIARRFIPAIVPDLAGKLYLIDAARGAATEFCSWLSPAHSAADFAVTTCWALRRGLPHRPRGASLDVPCAHLVADHDGCPDTLCLPLTAHGETFGLLYFEHRAGAPELAGSSRTYVNMLAENIGLALANLRLREQLRTLAMRDELTGLANRRQLEACLREAGSTSEPTSCLMVDVDHFKQFNDRFGHEAGDTVLRAVANVLQGAIRDRDLAARHGGEEFLLVLPGVGTEQASRLAEGVRVAIADLRTSHEGVPLGRITVSIGVASAPMQCSVSRLVRTADAAMLMAKDLGRDRVVVSGDRGGRLSA